MVDLAGGHQAKDGPGRLRGGARCALVTLVVELVARPILAPAAVGVLDRDEPDHGLAELGRLMVATGGIERGQHRPGAVDVVYSPAPVPAAVGELRAPQ